MLFLTFSSQEERRKYGGSDFIELQYCRLLPNTEIEDIVSVDAVEHWKSDSLYVYGDDMDRFYSSYGTIITGGIYNNMECGPVDWCGINFYSQEQAAKIIKRIEIERPPEHQALLDWLKAGRQYIGFYVLGE